MLKNYIIVALRNLLRNRTYTALNIFGLALGLACGMIVFWFIRFQTTHDNFHQNLDRIYQVTTEFKRDGVSYVPAVPSPMSIGLSNEMPEIKNTMVFGMEQHLLTILDKNNKPIKKFNDPKLKGAFVHKEYFEIFNFPWISGNIKSLEKPNVVAITQKLAKKFFNTEDVIGKSIRLDNQLLFEIIGIVKDIPENTDLKYEYFLSYQTLEANPTYNYGGPNLKEWGGINSNTLCFAMLPEKSNLNTYEKRLDVLSDKYHTKEAKYYGHTFIAFKDIRSSERYNQNGIKPLWLWLMAGIGMFLIVTACFNFINMATAQALRRAKEVGIRKAIGGTKNQIFAQFMIETAIITFVSLVIGFILAALLLPNISIWLDIDGLWQTKIIWTDEVMWLTLVCVFLVVSLLAGAYPSMILASFKPIIALKGNVSSRQIGGLSIRKVLIVFQFVLIQILIICTLIINNQVNFMMNKSVGYETKGILFMNIPTTKNLNTEGFREKLTKIAGVEDVSFCSFMPTDNSSNTSNHSFDNKKEDEKWFVSTKTGDSHYLSTFNLKLVAGQNIPQTDTVNSFMVNEKYLEKHGILNAKDAIGKKIKIWGRERRLCGVIKNWNTNSFREVEIQPIAVFSFKDAYFRCAVKFNTKSLQNTDTQIEKIWNEYFADYVFERVFLDDMIAQQYLLEKIMLNLIRIFSSIAIFIGCLGMFGLIRFMTSQKTKEIGVRKSYGASVGDILSLFGKEISKLILISFCIAAPIAWYLMNKFLENYPHRIAVTYDVVLLSLLITSLIALITVGYETYKAATQNPALALKTE